MLPEQRADIVITTDIITTIVCRRELSGQKQEDMLALLQRVDRVRKGEGAQVELKR